MRRLKAGGIPAQLLAVACAEPLDKDTLLDRADTKYGLCALAMEENTLLVTLGGLQRRGLLAVTGRVRTGKRGRDPQLYVLTPAGELALEQLFGEAPDHPLLPPVLDLVAP